MTTWGIGLTNPSKAIWQTQSAKEIDMTLVPVQCHPGILTHTVSQQILIREPFATLISLTDMIVVPLRGGVSKTIPMNLIVTR